MGLRFVVEVGDAMRSDWRVRIKDTVLDLYFVADNENYALRLAESLNNEKVSAGTITWFSKPYEIVDWDSAEQYNRRRYRAFGSDSLNTFGLIDTQLGIFIWSYRLCREWVNEQERLLNMGAPPSEYIWHSREGSRVCWQDLESKRMMVKDMPEEKMSAAVPSKPSNRFFALKKVTDFVDPYCLYSCGVVDTVLGIIHWCDNLSVDEKTDDLNSGKKQAKNFDWCDEKGNQVNYEKLIQEACRYVAVRNADKCGFDKPEDFCKHGVLDKILRIIYWQHEDKIEVIAGELNDGKYNPAHLVWHNIYGSVVSRRELEPERINSNQEKNNFQI